MFSYTNNVKHTPEVCVKETKICTLAFKQPNGTTYGMRLEDLRVLRSPSFNCFLSFAHCIKYSESLENMIPITIPVFPTLFVQSYHQDHLHNIKGGPIDPKQDAQTFRTATTVNSTVITVLPTAERPRQAALLPSPSNHPRHTTVLTFSAKLPSHHKLNSRSHEAGHSMPNRKSCMAHHHTLNRSTSLARLCF